MYRLHPRFDSPLHPNKLIAQRNIEALLHKVIPTNIEKIYEIIYSGDNVLIESEPGILFKFPLSVYEELSQFDHLDISMEICINNNDSTNEYGIPMVINLHKLYGINNVRELCIYMSRRVGVVESLGMYSDRQFSGRSNFEVSEFIDIIYKNGEQRCMMFDDFIKYFNLQNLFGNHIMQMYKFMM